MKSEKRKIIVSKITENEKIADGMYRLSFKSGYLAKALIPGQFIDLKIPGDNSLILRRPFSIYNVEYDIVSIIYMVVGKGTKSLTNVKPGVEIDVLGPLGNGFEIIQDKPAYLIGGGCGTPPLYFLAKKLKEKGIKQGVYLGFSSKNKVILEDEFKSFSDDVRFTTDDGSAGVKGNVMKIIDASKIDGIIYACGPNPLLLAVQKFSSENKVEAQLSLEERMGCGFGVCLGCAVKMKDGSFKYVCKDGPVFNASEVIIKENTKLACN